MLFSAKNEKKNESLFTETISLFIVCVKVIDPEDMSQRARWTIIATACKSFTSIINNQHNMSTFFNC